MRQVILACRDQLVRRDHDEMVPRLEWRVTLAGLRYDAAAIRERDQHSVPLEIILLRVVKIEQDRRSPKQFVSSLRVEITARRFRLSEADRHHADMALARSEEANV